jgi:hypothetical protein
MVCVRGFTGELRMTSCNEKRDVHYLVYFITGYLHILFRILEYF